MKCVRFIVVVCAMLVGGSLATFAQYPIIVGSTSSGVGNTYVKPLPKQNQGTYVPPGGTAPVPKGFKPDIIGTSPNGVPTVNGKERYDLMTNGNTNNGSNNNGSNNSSSNGSSATAKTCSKCLGSGVCRVCNGTKSYTPYIGASPVRCSSCNQTGKCSLCNGTGKFGNYRGY